MSTTLVSTMATVALTALAVIVLCRVLGRRASLGHTVTGVEPDDEHHLRRMLDRLPEAVVLLDDADVVVSCNAGAMRLARRCGLESLIGHTIAELVSTADRPRLGEVLDQVRRPADPSPDAVSVLVRLATLAGTEHPDRALGIAENCEVVEVMADLDQDEGWLVVRLCDVSDDQRHSLALEQARRRFQQAFHSAPTGMALVRLDDGRVVDANQSLADMLGHPSDDLVGRTLREFTHVDDVLTAVPHRARLELGIVDSYRIDQRFRRSDGHYIWARTRVSATEDDGVMLAITHIEDVTEQRRVAERLTHAARHDDLTGLPNRSFLLQMLSERLPGARPGSLAVLFVDLDRFKEVNDTLGHAVGDEVLLAISARLRDAIRDGDVLGRFGGDEFVVLLDGRDRPLDVHEVAARLRRACAVPLNVAGTELFVTASIGYSLNHDELVTAGDLMRDADAAMYRAKASGRDTVEGFVEGVRESTALVLRTAGELRRGIAGGEVVPYFQPIVDLGSGEVLGHEILARWLHPERGLLGPREFLEVAETHGLIVDLGEVMVREALTQLACWRSLGRAERSSIAVNVSTRQLVDPAFHDLIVELLDETGVDADSLWLEITETSLLADSTQVTLALHRLRELGVHLSVDDFGTGYSSLTYLRRFPVEAIKVDREFVSGLGVETGDTTIVEAVVRLGQSLGLTVVAEGIETPSQLERLRELGCDRGQGFLFGYPSPAAVAVG